ncbi:unnamed protein product [Cyclocybe aegerita]|uniref:Uncharacterized protein n=1 Tax=Cyclocybe aegerita TaxID=1973307 RepID=A0A8S0WCH0_CYCAE|nr:unnamed protein product [Cyclocybe aegerita]
MQFKACGKILSFFRIRQILAIAGPSSAHLSPQASRKPVYLISLASIQRRRNLVHLQSPTLLAVLENYGDGKPLADVWVAIMPSAHPHRRFSELASSAERIMP